MDSFELGYEVGALLISGIPVGIALLIGRNRSRSAGLAARIIAAAWPLLMFAANPTAVTGLLLCLVAPALALLQHSKAES